jgi:hypothetical protein
LRARICLLEQEEKQKALKEQQEKDAKEREEKEKEEKEKEKEKEKEEEKPVFSFPFLSVSLLLPFVFAASFFPSRASLLLSSSLSLRYLVPACLDCVPPTLFVTLLSDT